MNGIQIFCLLFLLALTVITVFEGHTDSHDDVLYYGWSARLYLLIVGWGVFIWRVAA